MPTRLLEMISVSTGGMTAGGVVLRLALAALSVFATVHLFSLWGTRYGDHNTSAKSFFLSLVLHGCFGLGWVTVAESYPRRPVGEPNEPELQIPITFVDQEDAAPRDGSNRLPIFHEGVTKIESPLTRDIRNASRMNRDDLIEEMTSPQRDTVPETTVAPELPEFLDQSQESAPVLEQSIGSTPTVASSTARTFDEPTAQSRPEAGVKRANRTAISRPAAADELATRPEFQRGISSQSTPHLDEGVSMMLPSEYNLDAPPHPLADQQPETVRRVETPGAVAVIEASPKTSTDRPAVASKSPVVKRTERMNRTASPPVETSDEIPKRTAVASVETSISRSSVEDRSLKSTGSAERLEESPAPAFMKPNTPTLPRAPARAAETYQARNSGQRMASALKHGGTEESERAVENSLKWFASIQEPDGHWSAARHGGGAVKVDPQGQDRVGGGKFADSGVSGLVVLSFLGAGYTHEKGPYTSEVRRGLNWLITQQSKNGYLGGKATRYDQNYCHAIATFALAEAYAMQSNATDFPELRNAVRRGVKLISAFQNDDGGWRYGRGGESAESDMSMFGWQLMALKSAVNAGIPVPEETRRGMVKFLEARGRGKQGGLAGYRPQDPPTPAMTAEALFCRQMFAVRTKDAASQEAEEYLRKHLPRITAYDEYYWYYGTLAMHHLDDDVWQEWNKSLRDLLISQQRTEGPLAGSWDPKGKWAGIGGRLYSTALSTMCLEVYYRYTSIAKTDSDP